MFTINVPNQNDSLVEVDLDEEVFFLHFAWNGTAGFWALSIENAYNDELVACLPIYPQRRLLAPVRNAQLPMGELVVVRNDELQTVGRDDFNNGSAVLIYIGVDDEL